MMELLSALCDVLRDSVIVPVWHVLLALLVILGLLVAIMVLP